MNKPEQTSEERKVKSFRECFPIYPYEADKFFDAAWQDQEAYYQKRVEELENFVEDLKRSYVSQTPWNQADEMEGIKRENVELEKNYYELILAVGLIHPNETRHQTALRYIRQAEIPSGESADTGTKSNLSLYAGHVDINPIARSCGGLKNNQL